MTTSLKKITPLDASPDAPLTSEPTLNDEPVRLPKELESHPKFSVIEETLLNELHPLWEKSVVFIPHIGLSEKIEKKIIQLESYRKFEKGIETIEKFLIREKNGIKATLEKTKTTSQRRISRLLLITNDGTERFYRMCDALMRHHEDRLLCIQLKCSSSELSEKLFQNSEKKVKALLITDKAAVSDFLISIIDS